MHPKVKKSREIVVLEQKWEHNYNFCTYLFIYLFMVVHDAVGSSDLCRMV